MTTIDGAADERPSAARMYDALLGGFHNTAADRRAAQQARAIYPDIALVAYANRSFLRRAVTLMLHAGIRQFLDLGSGIPATGAVHEIVNQAAPTASIVYVDTDPLATAYGDALLRGNRTATIINADIRQPATILTHPVSQRLLDPTQPIGVLLLAVLHFIPDDHDVSALLSQLQATLVPGSSLGISHLAYDGAPATIIQQVEQLYQTSTNPIKARSTREITDLFHGWELVEPGVVPLPLWRQDDPEAAFLNEPTRSLGVAGVAMKR